MKVFEKYWFLLTFLALLVTGIGFLYFRDFAPRPDAFSVISSPWQPWLIKFHILVAPIFVFWVGWISIAHTVNRLKRKMKRGRKTGLLNVGLLGVSILTGYFVQIITHEQMVQIVSNIHVYLSIFCFIMVLVHQIVSEKKKKHAHKK